MDFVKVLYFNHNLLILDDNNNNGNNNNNRIPIISLNLIKTYIFHMVKMKCYNSRFFPCQIDIFYMRSTRRYEYAFLIQLFKY